MTLLEIANAHAEGRRLDFSRHALEPREAALRKVFYPLGFPVEVFCDSSVVIELMAEMWKTPASLQVRRKAVKCNVYVEPSAAITCPNEPKYRLQRPHFYSIADANNFAVVDFEADVTNITLQQGLLQHRLYTSYFLLSAPLTAITANHATPLHAACVSWRGHGVLLCGDSGAGKSTLAYACARAGWTYTSDDACYLAHGGDPRVVSGRHTHVRFRPETASLFPELNKLRMTPRAAGKPSVELPLDTASGIHTAAKACISTVVFLDRGGSGAPVISTFDKQVARYAMQQTVFGMPKALRRHHRAIDELLEVPVVRLQYSSLDTAIRALQGIAETSGKEDGARAAS